MLFQHKKKYFFFKAEPPRIVATEPEVREEEGGYATLRCIVRGQPTPSVVWKKGGSNVSVFQLFKLF